MFQLEQILLSASIKVCFRSDLLRSRRGKHRATS